MKVRDYLGSALADMNIHRHNCDFTDDERDVYRNETEGLGFDFSDPEKMKADEQRVGRDADQAESRFEDGEDEEDTANEESSHGGDIANAYDHCMSMTTSLALCGLRAYPLAWLPSLGRCHGSSARCTRMVSAVILTLHASKSSKMKTSC